MAEVFAVTAIVSSIVQLVDFSVKVVERINEFQKHTQDIPKVFRGINFSLPVLVDGFNKTKENLDSGRVHEDTRKALAPLIGNCLLQVKNLNAILMKVSPTAEDSPWKRGKRVIRSFHKEAEVKTIERALRDDFHAVTQLLVLHQVTTNPLPEPAVPFEPTLIPDAELPPYPDSEETLSEMTKAKPEEKVVTRLGAFLLPFDRDENFINRQDILDQITQKFESHRRVAISGMGGVG